MAKLEVGEVGIVKFGEDLELLHPFDQPFTDTAGSQVIQNGIRGEVHRNKQKGRGKKCHRETGEREEKEKLRSRGHTERNKETYTYTNGSFSSQIIPRFTFGQEKDDFSVLLRKVVQLLDLSKASNTSQEHMQLVFIISDG